MADKKNAVVQTLTLLIPQYQVIFTPRSIVLKRDEEIVTIDEDNF
jgi:hypothetical protein